MGIRRHRLGPVHSNTNFIMKYMLILNIAVFVGLILFLCHLRGETVSINSRDITIERVDASVDLTASGTWFIQRDQGDWEKSGNRLYPNNDEPRAVLDAQVLAITYLNTYLVEADKANKLISKAKGAGRILSSQTEITYFAVRFKDGEFCQFYVRYNNTQYVLNAFADLADETAAAISARANLATQLAIISGDADANGKWK